MGKKKDEYEQCLEDLKAITVKALSETDIGCFIELLFKREVLIQYIVKRNIQFRESDVVLFLELEHNVLKRLEEEKKRIIEDLAYLGESKKAINKYSPKFPFPPLPAFYDKKG